MNNGLPVRPQKAWAPPLQRKSISVDLAHVIFFTCQARITVGCCAVLQSRSRRDGKRNWQARTTSGQTATSCHGLTSSRAITNASIWHHLSVRKALSHCARQMRRGYKVKATQRPHKKNTSIIQTPLRARNCQPPLIMNVQVIPHFHNRHTQRL